jgi:microcystin-dependent protein
MPGFGANDMDNELARNVLPKIDFAILIASSDKSFGSDTDSFRSLRAIKKYHIPYFFVLNCTKIDRWRCDDEGNLMIAKQDVNMLSFSPPETYPLKEDGLNIVNLMWYWYSICNDDDELINRRANRLSFNEYGIDSSIKEQLQDVSNFFLIKRLFDMGHREYFELKRYIKEEIYALRRELCPIGTIQAFATNSIPDGWMICDGRTLSINDYPELYCAIGTMYGQKDENHFIIPDLQGRFIRGWDRDGKIDANRVLGSPQDDAFQGHAHKVDSCSENGSHFHYIGYKHYPTQEANIGYSTYQHEHVTDNNDCYKKGTRSTDHDGNHRHEIVIGAPIDYLSYGAIRVDTETRPKNVALLFCIKVSDVSYQPFSNITSKDL